MLNKINPGNTKSWKALRDHFGQMKQVHMRDLFVADGQRFEKYSIRFLDILVDYSKNRINADTLRLLLNLAEETQLADSIEKMFSGDRINETENRAVLHTALRNRENRPIHVDGKDVMPEVNAVLEQMRDIAEKGSPIL
jgi:glucose-6-phosphate isomerase